MSIEHSPAIARLSLNWTERTNVQTRNGIRILLTARLTDPAFWTIWRRNKGELKEQGYAPSRAFDDSWLLNRWIPMDGIVANTQEQAAPALLDVGGVDTTGLPPQQVQEDAPDRMGQSDAIDPAGLMAWQVEHAGRIVNCLRQNRVALDASDVGTGKTYSAIAAFKHLGLRPLVVCPLAVIPSWHRAAKHFGVELDCINYEMLRMGKTKWGHFTDDKKMFKFTGINSDGGIVFDEVHRCKGSNSLNSKLLLGAKAQGFVTLSLSATAFTNPTEMKAIGTSLGLFAPNKHWGWCLDNGCNKGRWGGMDFVGTRQDLLKVHRSIFPSKGARIKVADLGSLFPKNHIVTRLVHVNEPGRKKIDKAIQAARDAVARIGEKSLRDTDSVLTLILRARQIAEAEKIPAMGEIVADAVTQGHSVVVFVNFHDTLMSLLGVLESFKPEAIHGQQKGDEREIAIAKFQANKTKVIIANSAAGGVGISLHDLYGGHPRMSLISPSHSAMMTEQLLGRIHRAEGKSTAFQQFLFAAGTIEEDIAAKTDAKRKNMQVLNDGDYL